MSEQPRPDGASEQMRFAVNHAVLDALTFRNVGMGNPDCMVWEILTHEGVAVVLTKAALNAIPDGWVKIGGQWVRIEPLHAANLPVRAFSIVPDPNTEPGQS